MEGQKLSLLQRRQQNLGNLQSTIKNLSALSNELKPPIRNSINKAHVSQQFSCSSFNSSYDEDKQSNVVTQPRKRRPSGLFVVFSEKNEHTRLFDEKYDIGEKIGEGAHGVVSKCVNKINQKLYAVKTLRWEDEHFRSLKTNFINIKQLKHPSLIQYKALFLNEKLRVCHTVLEYFPHPSLKPKTLNQESLKDAFFQILDGLSYLHKNHICHRDIKPDNLLYDQVNKKLKIIDFGVSKNQKMRGRYESMITDTGTFYYKAPEMFMGTGYTQAVDSWAVGISLYEMVTGSTPFASEYLIDTKQNILNSEADLTLEAFSNYHPLLKDLILQLLKKNPKERLSCNEAKKHIWFLSNVTEEYSMKSVQFKLKSKKSKQIDPTGTWIQSHQKKEKQANTQAATKTEKNTIKAWLGIINEDIYSCRTSNVAIQLVQSEDEEDFSPELAKSIKTKSMNPNSEKEPLYEPTNNKIMSHQG